MKDEQIIPELKKLADEITALQDDKKTEFRIYPAEREDLLNAIIVLQQIYLRSR